MCGIVAVSSTKNDIVGKLATGLGCMQHRGKESAGIALTKNNDLLCEKGIGLVSEALKREQWINLRNLKGDMGIGHIRYSTAGSADLNCAQPIVARFHNSDFAIIHNGNLINTEELRKYCSQNGYKFVSDTDTEVIAALISISKNKDFKDALKEALLKIKGAFSLIFLFQDKIYAARDPFGIRPMCIGRYDNGYVIASESLVIEKLSAKYFREVEPGEMVILVKSRAYYDQWHEKISLKFCIFEYIYFSFPSSFIIGRDVGMVREEKGCLLFEEHPLKADFVVGVPDSGKSAAYGYSLASGIPLDSDAIMRNRHIPAGIRSFLTINPDDRKKLVYEKFDINRNKVKGKTIVVVDDSIVRATVSAGICDMLRKADAGKIYWLSASPPYMYPCHYGIDTWRVKDELVAARHRGDLEKIKKEIGADYLGYLSLSSTTKATGLDKCSFCTACFNGEYPIS